MAIQKEGMLDLAGVLTGIVNSEGVILSSAFSQAASTAASAQNQQQSELRTLAASTGNESEEEYKAVGDQQSTPHDAPVDIEAELETLMDGE